MGARSRSRRRRSAGKKNCILFGSVLLAASVGLGVAEAQAPLRRAPVAKTPHDPQELADPTALLRADTITYDPKSDTTTAEGHVEINYQGQVLRADHLTYDQKNDVVDADGNVVLIDQDNNVTFSEHMTLTNKMRDGVIAKLGMLMNDDSRMAANSGVRSQDRYTVLKKVVYSPCDICKEDPTRSPLWQMKARRVIHDRERKEITYHGARMEMVGIPVFYTPYLSQPDPTVKRKTGFLTPSIGSKTDLGTLITIPFYWAISDSYDATFSPTFTSQQGVVARAEFRQRTQNGSYFFDGSITRPTERTNEGERTDDRDLRGHIFGQGRFDINNLWNWGFDVQRVTDDTYMRRYGISSLDRLENHLFVRRTQNRDFFVANAYAFQDLRAGDVPGQTPLVAPELMLHSVFEPTAIGGRFAVDGNFLSLSRAEGQDIHRLIGKVDWRRQFTTPIGQLITPFATLRTDLYMTDDVPAPGLPAGTLAGATDAGGTTFRALPEVGVEWRWPFARAAGKDGRLTQVIEPIAQIIYAPRGGNPTTIPNDDSVAFEFDDTNLFSENRFPGFDRFEDGARANYGVRAAIYWPSGAYVEGMIGQTYRFLEPSPFPTGSGMDTQSSDIVGRIVVSPSKYFGIYERFRINKETLDVEKSETELYLTYGRATASFVYAKLSPSAVAISSNTREAVQVGLNLRLTKYWAMTATTQEDLTNSQTVFRQIGLTYTDECASIGLIVRRDYTSDRDIRPSNSVLFVFQLANLS